MTNVSKSEELNESNRYIGGDDKPINLAETTGHFKLQLTKVRKFSITDETNVQLPETKDAKKATSVAQTKSSTKTKEEAEKDVKGEKSNDCAINGDGK